MVKRQLTSDEKGIYLRQEKNSKEELEWLKFQRDKLQLEIDNTDVILKKQYLDLEIKNEGYKTELEKTEEQTLKDYYTYMIKHTDLLLEKGMKFNAEQLKKELTVKIVSIKEKIGDNNVSLRTITDHLRNGVEVKQPVESEESTKPTKDGDE